MDSVLSFLSSHIASLSPGTIFFAEDLERLGFPAESVREALSRMARDGDLVVRLARGVYCHPRMADDPHVMARLLPSPEEIAGALARRWRVRIVPCGSQAAYLAGLIPFGLRPLTYLSDGSPQYFNLQKGRRIEFLRRRSAKVFDFRSEKLRNLVEGFRFLGKDGIGDDELSVAAGTLMGVPSDIFNQDIILAPAWIRDILRGVYRDLPH